MMNNATLNDKKTLHSMIKKHYALQSFTVIYSINKRLDRALIISDNLSTNRQPLAQSRGKRTVSPPLPIQKRATLDGDHIKIVFPYNPDDVDHVKTLPNRKFHSKSKSDKYWTCPASAKVVVQLRAWGFAIGDDLLAIWAEESEAEYEAKKRAANIGTRLPGFNGELLPHQPEAVAFIEERQGRALLADEQGLGKTIQALAYLALHPELRPAIIVVPATAKWSWEAETLKFLDHSNPEVLSGKKPYETSGDVLIINYDILSKWVGTLLELDPPIIILDEPQYIKTNDAQRTKAAKKLCKGRPLIGLSGTPGDSPLEFYNIIHMIDPHVFPNSWKYMHEYCGAQHNGFGWDFTGATKVAELHQILTDTIMLRRLKKDHLKDLPDKMYSMVPIELSASGKKQYNAVYSDFMERYRNNIKTLRIKLKAEGMAPLDIRTKVKQAMGAKGMMELQALKMASAEGKLDGMIDWIRDRLCSGEKLVVFATHTSISDAVYETFKDIAVKVDGDVVGKKRFEAVEEFQNNPKCRLFVGNIKACGVAITLTAASHIAILELPDRPSHLMQAEDRCHRIGQLNALNVYYLLGRGTVDGADASRLDKHKKVLVGILDGKEPENEELIGEMWESILELEDTPILDRPIDKEMNRILAEEKRA